MKSTNTPMLGQENFDDTEKAIEGFSIDSFNDPEQVKEYTRRFKLNDLCKSLEQDRFETKARKLELTVSAHEEKPFEPDYEDLCRLHWIILSRRVVNVLEFGSGYSTAVMADAMRILSNSFSSWTRENSRAEQPFHIFSVEEEQRFLEISQARLGERLSSFASISRSSLEITLVDNRISTIYSKIPNISPDFIYLDGPSQFGTTQELNGFSFASKARMPMSSDILRFEFFLEPGTLILVDGRTANARFLKAYLRQNWAYHHDTIGDVHWFELQEDPLGQLNRKKIEFCLKNKWLLA